MAGLYLPEELLQEILWQLKPPAFVYGPENDRLLRETLLSCLLSSKMFHRLALPVLYHTIDSRTSALLAPCLARYPDKAKLVRELRFSGKGGLGVPMLLDQENGQVRFAEPFRRFDTLLRPRGTDSALRGTSELTLDALLPIICTMVEVIVFDLDDEVHVMPDVFSVPRAMQRDKHIDEALIPLQYLCKIIFMPSCAFSGDNDGTPLPDVFPQLMHIQSISTITRIPWSGTQEIPLGTTSGLRHLSIKDVRLHPFCLESVLRASPLLESLEVEWLPCWFDRIPWQEFGSILRQHGPLLRKIRFDNSSCKSRSSSPYDGGIIDLSPLAHLRSVTLPIEAILAKPLGTYKVPADRVSPVAPGTPAPPGGLEYYEDEFDDSEFEEELYATHQAGQGLKSPVIPLRQLLPPTLRYLRILDDWDLWVDAIRLDKELRDLMTDPQFSELCCIRVRRQRPFTRHVKIAEWREESKPQNWHVLRRV